VRVVVVGAGLAGLVAARELSAAGAEVVVVERASAPGGRLTTRRIGSATFDVGAQFFTVRTPAFAAAVGRWVEQGVVAVWNHGFADADGYPRYVARGGMAALADHLARGLRVELDTMAFAVRRPRAGAPLEVVIDDGTRRPADAVVSTCPLPQTFALLVDAGIDADEQVFRTDYDRTVALLAVLDRPPALPGSGGVQAPDDVLAIVADNVSKGITATPAVTIHATAAWSEQHWRDDDDRIVAALVDAAAPWLGGAAIVAHHVKRWRFATPRSISPDPCWIAPSGDLVAAGDAFAGPRIEGAHNSGLAAAHALLR
jgi:predicted NAD/FAD-dependent oxidoreductase